MNRYQNTVRFTSSLINFFVQELRREYREACRAKSNADFISKIEGALQELDESDYWLELLIDGGFVAEKKLKPLGDETQELIAIFATMAVKAKSRNQKG